jgi:phosphoglycolate phosphatase-like HAD superfamily hydrolase
LFDVDGTLIATGGASDRAWHRAFTELHGVDVKVPEYTGKGVPDPTVGLQCFQGALRRDPTAEEMERLIEVRQRYLAEEVESSPGYRVMPGVESLLGRLLAEGRLLGLITGNTRPAAEIKLARANLNRFFAFGGFGSDAGDRAGVCRAALERAKAVVGGGFDRGGSIAIGDTPRDIEAGHAAGIRVVGVATGEYAIEQLTGAGADWAVSSLADGGLPF